MTVSVLLIVAFVTVMSLWIHTDSGLKWPVFAFGAVVWLGGANLLGRLLFRCLRATRVARLGCALPFFLDAQNGGRPPTRR